MLYSDIAGQLTCRGASLAGRDAEGDALCAHGMKVLGSVLLTEVFTAAGAIELSGADISGPLAFGRAKLQGRDNAGNALAADRMKSRQQCVPGRRVQRRRSAPTGGARTSRAS